MFAGYLKTIFYIWITNFSLVIVKVLPDYKIITLHQTTTKL